MSFSLSGSVITQSNEAGIAITAAASITGGVRFTCTQSYAAGNVVRITGTTSYNGNWMVAAVTGTTFDVLESAQGTAITFVSSQTGTAARGDASLAGISGELLGNWQLRFAAGNYVARVAGGNLVGGPAGDPIAYSAGVQTLLIQSAASTVVTADGGAGIEQALTSYGVARGSDLTPIRRNTDLIPAAL
jgi:hypothetical protein